MNNIETVGKEVRRYSVPTLDNEARSVWGGLFSSQPLNLSGFAWLLAETKLTAHY